MFILTGEKFSKKEVFAVVGNNDRFLSGFLSFFSGLLCSVVDNADGEILSLVFHKPFSVFPLIFHSELCREFFFRRGTVHTGDRKTEQTGLLQ